MGAAARVLPMAQSYQFAAFPSALLIPAPSGLFTANPGNLPPERPGDGPPQWQAVAPRRRR